MKRVWLVLTAFVCASTVAQAGEAADALARLKEGNERYVAGEASASKPTTSRRAETAQSQHPYAVIVGCADSRVPPEMVFDAGIGDLFVVRSAGNLSDDHALGSIEYAVEHLGTKLIVVLGHERCGAVTAAVAGPDAPGHVGSIVRAIRPAVEAIAEDAEDRLDEAIAGNARRVAAAIREQGEFGEHGDHLTILPAVYDLDTGVVSWLAE